MSRQIIVADDHPLFREALKAAVGRLETATGFVEADSVASLLSALEREPDADLLLLDLNMPGAQGFNALVLVRGSRPGLPVVVVSADDDAQTIAGAMRYGAQGFIPKSTEAGKIGLWTKADASSSFDNLAACAIEPILASSQPISKPGSQANFL